MIILTELKTYLIENLDPDNILELLQISSEDLVEAFADRVDDKFDNLILKLGLEDEI